MEDYKNISKFTLIQMIIKYESLPYSYSRTKKELIDIVKKLEIEHHIQLLPKIQQQPKPEIQFFSTKKEDLIK